MNFAHSAGSTVTSPHKVRVVMSFGISNLFTLENFIFCSYKLRTPLGHLPPKLRFIVFVPSTHKHGQMNATLGNQKSILTKVKAQSIRGHCPSISQSGLIVLLHHAAN